MVHVTQCLLGHDYIAVGSEYPSPGRQTHASGVRVTMLKIEARTEA